MSDDILTVKTVKQVRSIRGSALVHITVDKVASQFTRGGQKFPSFKSSTKSHMPAYSYLNFT